MVASDGSWVTWQLEILKEIPQVIIICTQEMTTGLKIGKIGNPIKGSEVKLEKINGELCFGSQEKNVV